MSARSRRLLALGGGIAALAAVVVLSLAIGSRPVPPDVVLAALTGGDVAPADLHAIVELRVPRTVVGVVTGAALGVAGALIQSITRNPLADPGILGVTAGSSFSVALAVALLGASAPTQYAWFAFGGALVATVAVALIGGGAARIDPVKLTLAGVAFSAVLTGIVGGLRLSAPRTFNALQVWEAGTLLERGWDVLVPLLPFLAVGLAFALLVGGPLNALALGEDVARSLGAKVGLTRAGAVLAIALLAGGATAVAGPISFLGLMVPHLARALAGPDQRWITGLTLLYAPVILLASDIIARVVLWPGEVPVGIVTAFVGAPVLIALVRRRRVIAL
ncbi:FecCD family ABC transporter permease [Microbacterium marinilacus]|uniref:Iron chelate uptake ABC transporter family permease subunit n=1 Tax=Microbacterium marinilacus TaxID=415209 RepID=A0ABP7BF40_9MICO|nr:iron chelate uptake ABC transporter family permease subunit [Microbacterium marinilacus]MBY0689411.1 iron chelate uptake ABC transporter family permease subunit [Microbacterium marinilacus]